MHAMKVNSLSQELRVAQIVYRAHSLIQQCPQVVQIVFLVNSQARRRQHVQIAPLANIKIAPGKVLARIAESECMLMKRVCRSAKLVQVAKFPLLLELIHAPSA